MKQTHLLTIVDDGDYEHQAGEDMFILSKKKSNFCGLSKQHPDHITFKLAVAKS